MTRVQIQTIAIRKLGHEHPMTVAIFQLCEQYEDSQWNNSVLATMLDCAIELQAWNNE